MAAATDSIISTDGSKLFTRAWRLDDRASLRGTIVVIHGLGEHSDRYAQLANFLNAQGYDVFSYDQRGHGNSDGKHGAIPYELALVDDAVSVFEHFAKTCAETPYLLGHSLGGAVALRAVLDGKIKPKGLILSSPAIGAHLNAMDKFQLALGKLTPNIAVSNKLQTKYLSHDSSVEKAYLKDPLVHDRITPRLANFVINSGKYCIENAAKLKTPTLFQIAGDDKLVNAEFTKQFIDKADKTSITATIYEGLYHEIYNEKEPERLAVLNDLNSWLLSHS